MNSIILWIFFVFGITIILTKARITNKFRLFLDKIHPELGYMSTCPLCMAFWVGIIVSLLGFGISGYILVDGFISSGIVTCIIASTDFDYEYYGNSESEYTKEQLPPSN